MTEREEKILYNLFGPRTGYIEGEPGHLVSDLHKRDFKVYKRLEEIGLIKLEPSTHRGLFIARPYR